MNSHLFNLYDLSPFDDEEEPVSLTDLMAEYEEEKARRRFFDSPEPVPSQTPPETPSPVAKSPRKRANFFSDLVDRIVERGQLLIAEEDGQAFSYDASGGFYSPIAHLPSYVINLFDMSVTRSLLAHDVRELTERLTWRKEIQCERDSFNMHPELVNLSNGVFNTETNELLPHDPRFRFSYQVRASYLENPKDISCPSFEVFCQSSLDGNANKRQLLLEFIGYICSDTNAGKCALFLKGQPNSGKSVISEFIARLFKPSLVSNVPLHNLGDRFSRAELAGKKLNVAGEIAGRSLRDISIFKSVTGSDRIMGEFKGRDPFYFTPRCKLLFSGNTLPLTTEADTTAAFVNRIRVLLFNQSIPRNQQDTLLLDRLWWERDSIVTLALHAAQQLAEHNFVFTMPHDSRAFLDSFRLRGNILGAFIDDRCILCPGARIFNTDLYRAFEDFCAVNGLDCLSRAKFYELLSGIPGVVAKRLRIGDENRQGHEGITLKEMQPPGTSELPPEPLMGQSLPSSSDVEPHIIHRRASK